MKTLVCMRLGAHTLLAIFLGSCSFGGRFADDAIDFNKTVEKATNAQILLNALRAKDRKPMHFSTFSQLRGGHTISSTGGLSFSLPFGPDAANAYTVSPSLNVTRSTSPTFDMIPSDSQEFHQGILQPIKMDTLAFYWEQRWPPELLLHLFIHKVKVEVYEKVKGKVSPKKVEGKDDEFENAPDHSDLEDFEKFKKWVENIMDEGLIVGSKKEGRGIGPILARDEVSDLKRLVGVETGKLRLIALSCPTKDVGTTTTPQAGGPTAPVKRTILGYRLFNVTESAAFCFGECEDPKLEELKEEECAKGLQGATISGTAGTEVPAPGGPQILTSLKSEKVNAKEYVKKYAIHLRSVQGILYHLGELVRAREEKGTKVEVRYGHGKWKKEWGKRPLFRLESVASLSAGDSPLAVEYDGKVYMVPADDKESGLTKTAMSLVVQLLGLNKTGKELPKTTAVEVVGR